eukprot:5399758-Pyramimonas_sp.AAC.1
MTLSDACDKLCICKKFSRDGIPPVITECVAAADPPIHANVLPQMVQALSLQELGQGLRAHVSRDINPQVQAVCDELQAMFTVEETVAAK